jgi:hypothetical protein
MKQTIPISKNYQIQIINIDKSELNKNNPSQDTLVVHYQNESGYELLVNKEVFYNYSVEIGAIGIHQIDLEQ